MTSAFGPGAEGYPKTRKVHQGPHMAAELLSLDDLEVELWSHGVVYITQATPDDHDVVAVSPEHLDPLIAALQQARANFRVQPTPFAPPQREF